MQNLAHLSISYCASSRSQAFTTDPRNSPLTWIKDRHWDAGGGASNFGGMQGHGFQKCLCDAVEHPSTRLCGPDIAWLIGVQLLDGIGAGIFSERGVDRSRINLKVRLPPDSDIPR